MITSSGGVNGSIQHTMEMQDISSVPNFEFEQHSEGLMLATWGQEVSKCEVLELTQLGTLVLPIGKCQVLLNLFKFKIRY